MFFLEIAPMTRVFAGVTVAALLATSAVGLINRATADERTQAPTTLDYSKVSPVDLVKQTSKGQLKNPYGDEQPDIVSQGEHIFLSYSCNGCHGGGGGGGICPPLTNDVWVYEGDDDTLFRLVTLGSEELQKQGYVRKGREGVVGPMPPFGALIKNSDELWKILTFVRSKYSPSADPKYKLGTPAELR
jgi:mono/diheme cytochrome c family protein